MPVNKMFNLVRSILSESMLLYKWTTLLLLLYPIKISRANLPGKEIYFFYLIYFNFIFCILHKRNAAVWLLINWYILILTI